MTPTPRVIPAHRAAPTVALSTNGGPCARVDLGIVKLHFELGAGTENFAWAGPVVH